jgi:hypothetical protein
VENVVNPPQNPIAKRRYNVLCDVGISKPMMKEPTMLTNKVANSLQIDKYVKRPFCVLNGEVKPNGHIWFGVGVSEDHYCSHGVRREKKDGD